MRCTLVLLLALLGPLAADASCDREWAAGRLKGAPCVENVPMNKGSIAGGQLVVLEGKNLWPDTGGADEKLCLEHGNKQLGTTHASVQSGFFTAFPYGCWTRAGQIYFNHRTGQNWRYTKVERGIDQGSCLKAAIAQFGNRVLAKKVPKITDKADCLAAAKAQFGDKVTAKRNYLIAGCGWASLPTGCSVQSGGDWAAHWSCYPRDNHYHASYTSVLGAPGSRDGLIVGSFTDGERPSGCSVMTGDDFAVFWNTAPDEDGRAYRPIKIPAPNPLQPWATVTIGGRPCEIEPIMSTSSRLVCRAPPSARADLGLMPLQRRAFADFFRSKEKQCVPGGSTKWNTEPIVLRMRDGSGGDLTDTSWNKGWWCAHRAAHGSCHYKYQEDSTPTIESVTPSVAAPGDLVTVKGKTCIGDVFEDGVRTIPALKRFQRVFVGPYLCELAKPECDQGLTKENCPTMYKATTTATSGKGGAEHWWTCYSGDFQCRLPEGTPVGMYNVSFSIPNSHGSSIVKPIAITEGFGEESPSYWTLQVVPKVTSVAALPWSSLAPSVSRSGAFGASPCTLSASLRSRAFWPSAVCS
jgi:hypothetical protein